MYMFQEFLHCTFGFLMLIMIVCGWCHMPAHFDDLASPCEGAMSSKCVIR